MTIKKQYIYILSIVLLWALLGFVLLTYTPLTWNIVLPREFWIKQIFQYVILILLFYLNMYIIVPRLLLKHNTVWFIAVNLTIVVIIIFINMLYDSWSHLPQLLDNALGMDIHRKGFDIFTLYTTLLVLGISTSITAIQNWEKKAQLSQQLQQQQVSSELSFLKTQIHPHFFFNTLNNIYALTFIDISTSREALHKLSWMMRYLLYETPQDVTLLSKELRFLKDYIELMRLRLNKHTTVVFEEPELLNDQAITPMLLMPFVENAFKHGVSASQGGEIRIKVLQEGNRLIMDVQNPVFLIPNEVIDDGGIGLANTQRRLNLLYQDRHQLSCYLTPENIYHVHLDLKLV